ncbi:alkaline-phosphatase-like protein [Pelagophyceae sp. CCMP2097]|nr:alkaline-phosphatase-like protein [Pelagophyceae sp. CCMP2097]
MAPWAALRLLFLVSCGFAAAEERSNVLFVISDDLRPQFGATYGGGRSGVLTPNLDRLAETAVVFDRAFTNAPSCNPSRNSFLTGRSPESLKIYWFEIWEPHVPSLFARLRTAGFRSFGVGKVFHSTPPPAGAFENTVNLPLDQRPEEFQPGLHFFPRQYDQEWGSVNGPEDCRPEQCACEETHGCTNGRVFAEDRPDSLHYFDNRVAQTAVDILGGIIAGTLRTAPAAGDSLFSFSRAGGSLFPFSLAVGFHHPHLKWYVPLDVWEQYANNTIVAPKHKTPSRGYPVFATPDRNLEGITMFGQMESVQGGSTHATDRRTWAKRTYPDSAYVEMRRAYAACVTQMDGNVGRVLGALAASPRIDAETVIVFTSDHGYGLGEAGHWGKSGTGEIDARVPLIIRAPGVAPGRTKALAELIDVAPTIFDLVHAATDVADAKKHFDGRSLGPAMRHAGGRDGSRDGNRIVFLQIMRCFPDVNLKAHFIPSPYETGYACGMRESNSITVASKTLGPQAPLMGYSVRSKDWRYVAWLIWDTECDDVDWDRPVWAEMLFDHRNETDLVDDWDHVNLLSPQNRDLPRLRSIADTHLRQLRKLVNFRRNRATKHGMPIVVRPEWREPSNPRCTTLRRGTPLTLSDLPAQSGSSRPNGEYLTY